MTPDEDRSADQLLPDHAVPEQVPGGGTSSAANDTGVVHDRRRPLRDMAGHELERLDDATRVSLVAYWASVAPAAFLLALEAFEQDTRW